MKTLIKLLAVAGLGLFGTINAAHAAPYSSYGSSTHSSILPGGCYGDSAYGSGYSSTYRPSNYGTAYRSPIGYDYGRNSGYDTRNASRWNDDCDGDRYGSSRNSSYRPVSYDRNDWRSGSYDRNDYRSGNLFEPWRPDTSSSRHSTYPIRRW